jgi:hypothetical protein
MKLTLIATIFAALATTGFSAAAAAANAILPVAPAAVDDTVAPKGLVSDGSENHRVLLVKDKAQGAGKHALGTKNVANKKDYSGQSCSLCCDDDYHC